VGYVTAGLRRSFAAALALGQVEPSVEDMAGFVNFVSAPGKKSRHLDVAHAKAREDGRGRNDADSVRGEDFEDKKYSQMMLAMQDVHAFGARARNCSGPLRQEGDAAGLQSGAYSQISVARPPTTPSSP
jgi:hypothetical protein